MLSLYAYEYSDNAENSVSDATAMITIDAIMISRFCLNITLPLSNYHCSYVAEFTI